jgi:hypothetical protein
MYVFLSNLSASWHSKHVLCASKECMIMGCTTVTQVFSCIVSLAQKCTMKTITLGITACLQIPLLCFIVLYFSSGEYALSFLLIILWLSFKLSCLTLHTEVENMTYGWPLLYGHVILREPIRVFSKSFQVH